MINSDGSDLKQLTRDAAKNSDNPRISGDSSRVVFQSTADLTGENATNITQVFVVNSDGSDTKQLTSADLRGAQDPDISGDGSRVTFETPADFVGIINSDGTGPLTEFRQINDGVLDTLEGSTVNNAASATGLVLKTGGTVSIHVPTTQQLSAISADTATGGPARVTFPFGSILYKTTSGIGGSVTTSFIFSSALPADLMLYKVDANGTYTEIPPTMWTKTEPNSFDLTLTDGGPFDSDGIANGVIVDPLAVGDFNAVPTIPELVSPSDGATGLGTTVDFKWKTSTDANNDTLTYDFFICDEIPLAAQIAGQRPLQRLQKRASRPLRLMAAACSFSAWSSWED